MQLDYNDDHHNNSLTSQVQPVVHHPISSAAESSTTQQDTAATASSDARVRRVKPKQKRNKPTLSCLECVDRKTKCDRGRPCFACVKRQSECQYTAVADLIASNASKNARSTFKAKTGTKLPKTKRTNHNPPRTTSQAVVDNGWQDLNARIAPGDTSKDMMPYMQSNVPFSKVTPSNVFGAGTKHAFKNYWTCGGGIQEVLSVLPTKDQADILVAKYFEAVDPVYPHVHRRSFYASYERFWSFSAEEQARSDPSLIALLYAMLSLGTQFLTFPSNSERSQTAEFYSSAAHQALRVYSYLNRTSMRAISAMLLIAYFLMNDNHVSDAFAWAGIYLRQAYAMRLHRDPDSVVAEASELVKQQRRKLWQAVFVHDTSLTLLLKLPPTATHSDVPPESLIDDTELPDHAPEGECLEHTRVENLMSISVIAPQHERPAPPPEPHHMIDDTTKKRDVAFLRSMWQLGVLVQENLSSPNSLSIPLADDPKQKETLVTTFRNLYPSFPRHLTQLDFAELQQESQLNPRSVRQNLFLNNHYHHCIMLLEASENKAGGVTRNIVGTLQAAHEVMLSYFKLWHFFPDEAFVWWDVSHRAFEAALMITRILSDSEILTVTDDSIVGVVKTDIIRMLETMDRCGEIHRTRWSVLQENFEKIIV